MDMKLGQTSGDGKGQGSLACCSLWDRHDWVTEQQQQKQLLKKNTKGIPKRMIEAIEWITKIYSINQNMIGKEEQNHIEETEKKKMRYRLKTQTYQ